MVKKILVTFLCGFVICGNCLTVNVDLFIQGGRREISENDKFELTQRIHFWGPQKTPNEPRSPQVSSRSANTNFDNEPKNLLNRNNRNFSFPKEDRNIPGPHEYHPSTNAINKVHELRPTNNISSTSTSTEINDTNTHDKFTNKLQQVLVPQFATRNLIYSPISLQTNLALLYLGAENETAKQLRVSLELPESTTEVKYRFLRTLSEAQRVTQHFQLVLANKIYYQAQLSLHSQIKDTASQYFYSEIAPISFKIPTKATKEINQWVADKTHNHIKDVIAEGSFDTETEAVIVNAVYMKANWAIPFSTADTLKQQFRIDDHHQILVDMMYVEDDFRYRDFPELDAQIVEMPFQDNELTMLIILPNKDNGLAAVESYISNENLNYLLAKMEVKPMTLRLPKFHVEMEIDMIEPLQKIGITNIFSNSAQLGKFFSNHSNAHVSKVKHKAYIKVNEGGVEAAAASFSEIVPLSLQPNMIQFTADHPFMFAIRSSNAIYFIGHVIKDF